MQLYRVRRPEPEAESTYAVRRDGEFVEVNARLGDLPGLAAQDLSLGDPLPGVSDKDVLAPSLPTKVVCVGRNYRRHAEELGNAVPEEPLIFLKPPSALIGPGQAIELPAQSAEVHHEGELAVVIGRRARKLSVEQAPEVIAGYTCANDVTARDLQRKDKTFTRGKGFDTFCPVGPTLALASEFDLEGRAIACRVNGRRRQQGSLDDFIFGIAEVLAFITDIMTLEVGDLVLTGTPEGVGPIEAGDTVDVEVEGIGTLRNPVVG